MITFHRSAHTRRAPRGYALKSHSLRMIGHAAVWHFEQAEALAARLDRATAICPCCDTVYPVDGLKRLDSYAVYERASQVVSFNWDDPICRFCTEDFEADFGSEDTDVYHVYDRNLGKAD